MVDGDEKYDGHLTVKWSKRERDFVIWSPCRPDGHLAHNRFSAQPMKYDVGKREHYWEPSFIEELRSRGYDTTTLRFSVKRLRKKPDNARMATSGPVNVDGDGRDVA